MRFLRDDTPKTVDLERCAALVDKLAKANSLEATEHLSLCLTQDNPFPDGQAIKDTHLTICYDFYKDIPGKLRSELDAKQLGLPDTEIEFGRYPRYQGALACNVARELKALNEDAKRAWDKALTPEEKGLVLFHHNVKMVAIQPAMDVNKRTAYAILAAQTQAGLGQAIDKSFTFQAYSDAVMRALGTGKVDELSKLAIGMDVGPKSLWQLTVPAFSRDLHPDPASYRKLVSFLADKADQEGPVPSIATLKEGHALVSSVPSEAGRFRTSDRALEEPATGQVWEPTLACNLMQDLRKLTWETKELLGQATSKQDVVQAITAYHARFDAMQLFDNCGCLGLAIADVQSQRLLGRELTMPDGKSYALSMKEARGSNALAYAASVVFGEVLDGDHQASPYVISPWPQDVEKTTDDGLVFYMSAENLEHTEVLAAEAVPKDTSDYVRLLGNEVLVLTPDEDGKLQLDPGCKLALEEAREAERADDLVARKEDLRTRKPDDDPDDPDD